MLCYSPPNQSKEFLEIMITEMKKEKAIIWLEEKVEEKSQKSNKKGKYMIMEKKK